MPRKLRTMLPLYVGFIASGAISTLAAALLPAMRAEIAMTYFQSGLVLSGTFMGMFAAVLVTGFLADRIGHPAIVAAGGVFLLAGLALSAAAPAYPMLLAGVVIAGIGFGFFEVGINALCADIADPDKPGASMSFLHFFYGTGAIAGPVFASLCVDAFGSWRLAFASLTVLPVAVLILLGHAGFPKHGISGAPGSILPASGAPFLVAAGFAIVAYVGAETSAYGWLPLFWDSMEARPFAFSAPLTATVFWTFITLGRLLFGRFVDRLGFPRYLALSGSAALVGSVAWHFAPGPVPTLVFASLLGLCCSNVYPAIMASANTRFPEHTGFVTAWISLFAAASGFVIPAGFGRIADAFSIRVLPLALAALSASILAFVAVGWFVLPTGTARTPSGHGRDASST
ncbi:MAG: MFS transporter [Spirochaetes bacterium]|nr:MFS transporter [Spirochaetota bacterium]